MECVSELHKTQEQLHTVELERDDVKQSMDKMVVLVAEEQGKNTALQVTLTFSCDLPPKYTVHVIGNGD